MSRFEDIATQFGHDVMLTHEDVEYLVTLVRQQMRTREATIGETLLAYAELLKSHTYKINMGSGELVLAEVIHLLERDSEDFDPRKWPS